MPGKQRALAIVYIRCPACNDLVSVSIFKQGIETNKNKSLIGVSVRAEVEHDCREAK